MEVSAEDFRKQLLSIMEREDFKSIHENISKNSTLQEIYIEMMQGWYQSDFGQSEADKDQLQNLLRFTKRVGDID